MLLSKADVRDSASLLTHDHMRMSDAYRYIPCADMAEQKSQSLSPSSQVQSKRTDLLSVDRIAEPLPILAFCSISESASRKLLES